jgi:hypothetical protein
LYGNAAEIMLLLLRHVTGKLPLDELRCGSHDIP